MSALMNLNPVTIGVPVVYESYYKFDTNKVLQKAISIANLVSNFKKFDDFLELGNGGTTASEKNKGPHTWPELFNFNNWVLSCANQILRSWGYSYDKIAITDSWVNCHLNGGWTNFHTHQNTHLSLVAYITAPENSGDLLMIDPLENHWMGYPTDMNLNIIEGQPIKVSDNKVIFFAPFLRHGTQRNQTNNARWVISMNISTFKNEIIN